MICPYCQTDNRDDRAECYNCQKDLTMLRLIVNKAKAHFNTALEHAERGRNEEAISELHNALDLDNKLVNAHVVLGTLYAKTDQLEKAREQWEEALEIDPRMAKAHQYLEKLETGSKNLPVVRRLRLELISLLILSVILFIAVISLMQPDPGRTMLLKVNSAYSADNYASALSILEKTSELPPGNNYFDPLRLFRELIISEQAVALMAAEAALENNNIETARKEIKTLISCNPSEEKRREAMELLTKIDNAEENMIINQAKSALKKDDFQAAVKILQGIQQLDREPNPETIEKINAIRVEAAQIAREHARRSVDAMREGAAAYPQVQQVIEQARTVLPSDVGTEASTAHIAFLNQLLEQAKSTQRLLEKELLLAEHQQGKITTLQLLTELKTLQNKYPDDKNIAELINTFSAPLRREAARQFHTAMQNQDYSVAETAIKNLKDLAAALGEDPNALEAMENQLKTQRIASAIEQLRKAYKAENDETVIEIAKKIDHVDDPTTAAVIESLTKRANTRLARKRFEAMLSDDYRYETATMGIETAERTIRQFDQVFEHLPTAIYPTSRDNLLFYLAQSHRRLGQIEQAQEALNRLLKEYPDSNVKEQAQSALKEISEEQKWRNQVSRHLR